jgi:hypothetical protein
MDDRKASSLAPYFYLWDYEEQAISVRSLLPDLKRKIDRVVRELKTVGKPHREATQIIKTAVLLTYPENDIKRIILWVNALYGRKFELVREKDPTTNETTEIFISEKDSTPTYICQS